MSVNLDLEGILLVLTFVAPGFLFTRTYLAFRPRYYRAPSTFEQTVLSIVGSVLIHGAMVSAISIAVLIYWAVTGDALQLYPFLGHPIPMARYPVAVLAIFSVVGLLYLTVSLILARRLGSALGLRSPATLPAWWVFLLGQDPPERLLLWHTMLQEEPLRLGLIPPHLVVQMRSGEYFEGDLDRLRLVGDDENTVELALRNVRYRPANSKPDVAAAALPDRVVLLRSSDILWLGRVDRRGDDAATSSTAPESAQGPDS
ncbi:MAG: DUF6338 family protein [Anaerolineae bacterium]